MATITYGTVVNANRPGLWLCHDRYADKRVTPTAKHNSQGEVPYDDGVIQSSHLFFLKYRVSDPRPSPQTYWSLCPSFTNNGTYRLLRVLLSLSY